MCLEVDEGCIVSKTETGIEESDTTGRKLPVIAPGLTDLQINGCHGIDFNSDSLNVTSIISVTRKLVEQEGVTSYFPTITTDSVDKMAFILQLIREACEQDELCGGVIAGIHLEGPFISPVDGPRGAHVKKYVQAPNWELFRFLMEQSGGRVRLITLSPEWPRSTEFIRKCINEGVLVALGHMDANVDQIHQAVQAGASLSTHLGNGCHPVLPRHPNVLWVQLAEDDLWTSLIADGFHLPESFIRVALKIKQSKTFMVSDAVHFTGMPPGIYQSHNRIEVVKTEEGRLQLKDTPELLAGSAQTLLWGIRHLCKSGICSLSDAWDMASVKPATYAGLPNQAGLTAGAPADLVLFDVEENEIKIRQVYKKGFVIK